MNKLSNIPNKIKQPSACCTYCGKGYKTRTHLEKHALLCEVIYKSKKKLPTCLEEKEKDEEIPSQLRLFHMLLELGQKYNRLEEKVEEMNKWIVKKKKNVNVLEWLNTHVIPNTLFEHLSELIIICDEDIEFLLNNSFNDTLNNVFTRHIYNVNNVNNVNNGILPIFAFDQKANVFYVYGTCESSSNNEWINLSNDKLIRFLNIIQMKISKAFQEWKKKHIQQIKENDNISILCDKALIKIMSVEFKQEIILNKIKNMIFTKMKTDMKALIEIEF